jgi:threonine 3-dehydrogenase
MKALVKRYPERGLWLEDVPVPEIGEQDVLVKIHKTSICGTDLHIYEWNDWASSTVPIPMQIGHEFVGEVAEMGSLVQGLSVGETVSGEGHIVCGHCRNCRAGRRHLCVNSRGIGVNRPGCFAEYLSIPATNVFPIPHNITEDEAAILDPFGNAVHTALSFDLIGEDVLITGAGPIGIMAAVVAQHVGARYVVITDFNEYRLDLARKMGISHAVNPRRTKLRDLEKTLGMTEGFDVGLEMSGSPAALRDLIDLTRGGGKLALLGILPRGTSIDWSEVVFKGLFIKGIYGREMFETWYKMLSMLQSGLNISPILTHRFTIDQYRDAFEIAHSGNSGKVLLKWT